MSEEHFKERGKLLTCRGTSRWERSRCRFYHITAPRVTRPYYSCCPLDSQFCILRLTIGQLQEALKVFRRNTKTNLKSRKSEIHTQPPPTPLSRETNLICRDYFFLISSSIKRFLRTT